MNKIFVPPIKCQGIKTKLVPWILQNISFDEKGRWVEPFMGSGVVGFNLRPRKALFCDVNPHLINFYNALKDFSITPNLARKYLEHEGALLTENPSEHYYLVRERFNNSNDPLDFLFLNRSCFNGLIRFNKRGLFNVPFGHKPNRFSKAYITKIINQIEYVFEMIKHHDWEFIAQDFRATFKNFQSDKNFQSETFIYCDPPYNGRHVDYFDSWSDEDERDLYSLLRHSKSGFMLSTWHSNKYRENKIFEKNWEHCEVITKEHFYHVGGSEENRNPMIEALIMHPQKNLFKQARIIPKDIVAQYQLY